MTAPWAPLNPTIAASLSDTRRQLHHAAQFATALGISYLSHKADDSHTNLEWLLEHRALACNRVPAVGVVRLAVRVPDLTVLLLQDDDVAASHPLRGQAIPAITDWLREALGRIGLAGERYSLARHYEIPPHAVADGIPFSADAESLEQLARWFGNAAVQLDAIRSANDGSTVRCWPHHFDIATLITARADASVGVGLEPGDLYYDEPYFYVNASPQPAASKLPTLLKGGGMWHTHEWIGAVLPASHMTEAPNKQEQQVREFLESAVSACRSLVSPPKQ